MKLVQFVLKKNLRKILIILSLSLLVLILFSNKIENILINPYLVPDFEPSTLDNLIAILLFWMIIAIPLIATFIIGGIIFHSKLSAKFSFWMILFCPLIFTIVLMISVVILMNTTSYYGDLDFGDGIIELLGLPTGIIFYIIFSIIYSIILYKKKKKIVPFDKGKIYKKPKPLRTFGIAVIVTLIGTLAFFFLTKDLKDSFIFVSFLIITPAIVIVIGQIFLNSKRTKIYIFFMPLIAIVVFSALSYVFLYLIPFGDDFGTGLGIIIFFIVGNLIYLIFGIIYSLFLYRKMKKLLYEKK